jgi:hypothetical protein
VQQSLTSIVEDGTRAGEVINRIRALMKKAPPSITVALSEDI